MNRLILGATIAASLVATVATADAGWKRDKQISYARDVERPCCDAPSRSEVVGSKPVLDRRRLRPVRTV